MSVVKEKFKGKEREEREREGEAGGGEWKERLKSRCVGLKDRREEG